MHVAALAYDANWLCVQGRFKSLPGLSGKRMMLRQLGVKFIYLLSLMTDRLPAMH